MTTVDEKYKDALRSEADKWIEAYFSDEVEKDWVVAQVANMPAPQAMYVAVCLFREIQLNRSEVSDGMPVNAFIRRLLNLPRPT